MANKKIVVDTRHHTGRAFKVNESEGRLHVYEEREWGPKVKIGEAPNIEDAIHLIKAHLGTDVHNIRIKDC